MKVPVGLEVAAPSGGRATRPPRHLADLTEAERAEAVIALGDKGFRARQLSVHYFEHLVGVGPDGAGAEAMTDLPAAARQRLAAAMLPWLLTPVRELTCDNDQTVKTVWQLFDGSLVESVLMRYPERVTV